MAFDTSLCQCAEHRAVGWGGSPSPVRHAGLGKAQWVWGPADLGHLGPQSGTQPATGVLLGYG